ncbi:hypothetical protein BI347_09610 [Chromobacterium sphagni]|uniref:Uncharacterized protein n=1 Tax=Chromobacterium sphagni TaxID=1903179 RepID=A0A1S1X2I8_9NEIS|nr:hypothetical protein [Chromobacterium sphagni]OHX13741.1 hypothetical protein BI347_09610 [Chromobacterium sphagni]
MMTIALPLNRRPILLPGRVPAIAASLLLHLLALVGLNALQQEAMPPALPLLVNIRPIALPSRGDFPAGRPAPPAQAAASTRASRQPARKPAPSPSRRRQASADKRHDKAEASTPRVTIEGLRQQIRRLEPENPNAKPLQADAEKARLARNIDQAQRKDCKNAYSALGLLAAPFLLRDALDKDNGCKW